jgi:hypothetical protein
VKKLLGCIVLALALGGCGLTPLQLGDIGTMASNAKSRASVMRAVANRYPPKAGEDADFKACLDKAAKGIEAQAQDLGDLCRVLNIQAPAK